MNSRKSSHRPQPKGTAETQRRREKSNFFSASLRLCAVLYLCVILALSGSAEGHASRRVKLEELHLFRDRAVLFLRYTISEVRFIADLRERFDLDATRNLDADERNSLVEYAQMLATEDLRLRWDGEEVAPAMTLKATSGLDRELPSAYPIIFYWQLDFALPADAGPADGRRTVHELFFEDKEARWDSTFTCRVRLAPGVKDSVSEKVEKPRSFEFPSGRGSFRINIHFQNEE